MPQLESNLRNKGWLEVDWSNINDGIEIEDIVLDLERNLFSGYQRKNVNPELRLSKTPYSEDTSKGRSKGRRYR